MCMATAKEVCECVCSPVEVSEVVLCVEGGCVERDGGVGWSATSIESGIETITHSHHTDFDSPSYFREDK